MEIKTVKDFGQKSEFLSYLKHSRGDIERFKMSRPRDDSKAIASSVGSKLFSPVSYQPLVSGDQIATEAMVKVVANTSEFIDSHLDFLERDGASLSLVTRKGIQPHLHDHSHRLLSTLGDVQDIYYQDVPLRSLGWNADGNGQALVMETLLKRSYNDGVFGMYADGRIKQHSVGLMYRSVKLCVLSEDKYWRDERDNYEEYIERAINKEKAEEYGYFWVVPEWELLENSGVLFGSNELTPTLSIEATKYAEVSEIQKNIKKSKNNTTFAKALNDFNSKFN